MARGTLALLLVTLFLLGSQHTVSGQEDAISEVCIASSRVKPVYVFSLCIAS